MSLWSGLSFSLNDAPDAAASSGAAGGGFKMSTDEMTTLLGQVKATRDKCREQVRDLDKITTIRPPAQDQGSVTFTTAAHTSREARNQFLTDQLTMYEDLVTKLEKALGITTEADQQAADAAKQAGGEGKYS